MLDPTALPSVVTSLKARISVYTVDRLKGIIQGFNEHCGSNLNRTGKKSELQEKLKAQLDHWEATNSTVSIANAKKILDHIDQNGTYNAVQLIPTLHTPTPLMKRTPLPQTSTNGASGPSNSAGPSNGTSSYSSASRSSIYGISFKSSPFFEIEQHVSSVTQCPESLHMQDRKTVTFEFSLTTEQREKLTAPNTEYQLRLYCTSSLFYTAPTAFRPSPTNGLCPMEFPNTCEIRVNNVNLHAQTKGLKKKPGTAPPANLASNVRTGPGVINKVEILYCNQNPVQGQSPNNRKYYVQVNLVKATAASQLVERLRKGKYKAKEEILRKMKQDSVDDDEIEAGPQKLSLKCPLSYSRIEIPMRSSACPHPSCFDGDSWFSMMEVTTTWQCPICEKTLNLDELIVDGYFDNILKTTDEDVEDVILESNGDWHTQDGKYHSEGWVPPPGEAATTRVASTSTSSSTTMQSPEAASLFNGFDKAGSHPAPQHQQRRTASFQANPAEEIVLDSDSDDDANGPVIPSATALRQPDTRNRSASGGGGGGDVIDLTLSESEDEAPLARTFGKRKDRSPTDGSTAASDTSKRMRYEGGPNWRNTREPSSGYRSSWTNGGTSSSTPSGYGGGGSGSSSNYGMRSSSSTYPPPPSASASSISFLPPVNIPPSNSYGGTSAYAVSPPSNALPSPSITSASPNVNSPPLPSGPGAYRPETGPIILPPLQSTLNFGNGQRLPGLPNPPISPRTFPPPHRPPSSGWRPPSPERDMYPRRTDRW